MNSSLAAILASPVSGVSGAVTGYPIGRGNGVSTVFAAPPEITEISAVYRTDWQGTVALSASARTNFLLYSQELDNAVWQTTNCSVQANTDVAPDGTMTADKAIPSNGTAIRGSGVYQIITKSAVPIGYCLAVSVKSAGHGKMILFCRDNASAANKAETVLDLSTGTLSGTIADGTFSGASATVVPHTIPGWYRVKLKFTTGAETLIRSYFLNDVNGNGVDGIYLWGWHLDIQDGSYIPTTTTPITVTDYVVSGTTLTLAEVPALAAELTVDGTGVNIPLLQIGGY